MWLTIPITQKIFKNLYKKREWFFFTCTRLCKTACKIYKKKIIQEFNKNENEN
jgi:hypothetical protein